MAHHALQVHPVVKPVDDEAASPCPLLENMPGTSAAYRWHGDRIHYRCMGDGPPLVLAHAPDIGACCMEWRRNIEALSRDYTVFAVDLPGYGLSATHPGAYTADLYIRFLADFMRNVSGTPARAIGSMLGAGYLVHVADRWPGLVDRLLLVAPAGLSAFRPGKLSAIWYQALGLPALSASICGATTSRCSILEHLQEEVYQDERLAGPQAVDVRYWVCHRPHAEYVERSRLAGLLNTDIRAAVGRLRQPVMVVCGRSATNPPLSDLETFRELNPRAMTVVFEHSALAPHEEEWSRFNHTAQTFLEAEFAVSAPSF
jgi:pimeloyl-ACP methyl ester carboxylesterase